MENSAAIAIDGVYGARLDPARFTPEASAALADLLARMPRREASFFLVRNVDGRLAMNPSNWRWNVENRSVFSGTAVVTCLCLLCGCASPPSKPQVTVDEVVTMSKQGTPADAVIEKMRDSESVYRLSASKLLELKREGVPGEVLDYMEHTYLTEACRQAIWDDRGHLYTARTIEGCN
jgi:hypothetical protein